MPKEVIVENNLPRTVDSKNMLEYLPGYARFIKDNCMVPYIHEQLRISREIKLPMLKYFENISDDEIISMSIESTTDFLTSLEENTVKELLDKSLEKWVADRLVIMKREEITAEDITLAGYIRKKALLKFLPSYTTDINEAVEIIKEIDLITVESDTAATRVYINLLNERISAQVETEKQITQKLKESEQTLLKANEIAHVGNWTWDLNTNKIVWSDELYRIYGITKDFDLTFENIIAFTDEADVARIKHNLKVNKGMLTQSEAYFHINLQDGTQKVLHAKTETLPDNDGQPSVMIGVLQDVTEKQLLIERLQSSEALYKQAQAISHIGNWSWDLKTRKLEWSDEIYRIYEMEPEPVTYGGGAGLYNHPEDSALISESIGNAIKTLEPFDFNYRIILKSGKIKTLNARGTIKTDAGGQPAIIYGTIQDITEQKAIEKQLKDYREFINKITDVTPSVIAAYNVHTGKYSFINKAVEKMLGYPASRIMDEGVPFFLSIIHPDDIGPMMEENARELEKANQFKDRPEPVIEFKYRLKNTDGEYRWFHTYGTIFERNKDGLVETVLNVSVDITAQEVAEQALFQKNLQLQRSNNSLEEYAYVASHDLKEPLRKISTFSDRLLTTQTALTEEGKNYLSKIISSAKRMQQMINDLLAVSTIMGNNAFETCDLEVLVNDALLSLDYKIEESKATIETDNLPAMKVVPSQFRQLFQNLINNSLKFARKDVPPRVKITHGILSGDLTAKYPQIAKSNKYLKIELQDNGIGFDNDYAEKIFAIFQRLHSKSEYEGTGIGLAVCRKIAENHGGIITASGIPNKGATFTIIIPVK